MDVSVCITSYQRPCLLREAVQSCIGQSHPPFEILIGDDSPDDRCVATARQLMEEDRRVEFVSNRPGLGKAKNIDMLLGRTRGDKVVLLHDDDLLLPGALENLCRAFRDHPEIGAAFGPQVVIHDDGTADEAASERLNRNYLRTPDRCGLLADAVKSAITGQFPNDGYMVDGSLARGVSFYDSGRGAVGGDFRFAWNLARQKRPFCLVAQPISAYRLTRESMSSRGTDTGSFYVMQLILEELANPALMADPDVRKRVSQLAKPAISQAAALGRWRTGLKWYVSPFHRGTS